jgi:hypothetical protein
VRQAHEGNMYRHFEGEADRSHHGLPPDKLYSTAYNMRTNISKGALVSACSCTRACCTDIHAHSLQRLSDAVVSVSALRLDLHSTEPVRTCV